MNKKYTDSQGDHRSVSNIKAWKQINVVLDHWLKWNCSLLGDTTSWLSSYCSRKIPNTTSKTLYTRHMIWGRTTRILNIKDRFTWTPVGLCKSLIIHTIFKVIKYNSNKVPQNRKNNYLITQLISLKAEALQ